MASDLELMWDAPSDDLRRARAMLHAALVRRGATPTWQEWRRGDTTRPRRARRAPALTLFVRGKAMVVLDSADKTFALDVALMRLSKQRSRLEGGLPLTVLASTGWLLVPKCPLCVAAYAGVAGVVGLSVSAVHGALVLALCGLTFLILALVVARALATRTFGPLAPAAASLGTLACDAHVAASLLLLVAVSWSAASRLRPRHVPSLQ